MGLAAKELLGIPDQAPQVDWQGAILLGIAQHLIPQNSNVLLNRLKLVLQDLAGLHIGPDCLQGVLLQVVRLEARVIKVVGIHGLQDT